MFPFDLSTYGFIGESKKRVWWVLRGTLVTAAVLIWTQSAALAQGGSQIVYQQRTPWLEATVVMALCGAALFAVCRSSRRN